jgi:hypothetical protein
MMDGSRCCLYCLVNAIPKDLLWLTGSSSSLKCLFDTVLWHLCSDLYAATTETPQDIIDERPNLRPVKRISRRDNAGLRNNPFREAIIDLTQILMWEHTLRLLDLAPCCTVVFPRPHGSGTRKMFKKTILDLVFSVGLEADTSCRACRLSVCYVVTFL